MLRRIKSIWLKPGHNRVRKIKTGPFAGIAMDLDLANQTQLFLGLFERECYKPLRELSRGIRSAVDIGAYEGEYSLFFLLKTQAEKVFAFEPLEHGRARLRDNLAVNDLQNDRIIVSEKFVSSSIGENSTTLDALLPDLLKPVIVKIDVDGAEVDILTGASKLLLEDDVRWLIETHSPELETECIRILSEAGYTAKVIDNAWWRVILPELRVSSLNRWLVATRDSLEGTSSER